MAVCQWQYDCSFLSLTAHQYTLTMRLPSFPMSLDFLPKKVLQILESDSEAIRNLSGFCRQISDDYDEVMIDR